MKKFITTLFIVCILITTGVIASEILREYTAKEVDYIVEINGEVQSFELPVVSIEDRSYVALRQLCEKIGYQVDWIGEERKIKLSTKEKNLPYYEDITKSKEGELSNGRAYYFTNKEDFSYQEQIEQLGLSTAQSQYGEVPTAKMAAELGQIFLGYENSNIDDITIQVYFDKEEDAWYVFALPTKTTATHSGLRAVVIQREDGKIVEKYELR